MAANPVLSIIIAETTHPFTILFAKAAIIIFCVAAALVVVVFVVVACLVFSFI